MRITIFGTPSSGKTTVFKALTGADDISPSQSAVIRSVRVPDERIDTLSRLYTPKKTTYAVIEYVDLQGGASRFDKDSGEFGTAFLTEVRPAVALVHVIDAFSLPEAADEMVAEAIETTDTELVLADLTVVERRIDRLRRERVKSGPGAHELALLEDIQAVLEEGICLRTRPDLTQAVEVKHFSFLSAKPVITVVNISEDNLDWSPDTLDPTLRATREGEWGRIVPLAAALEAEIALLSPEEAQAFAADYGIERPARERIIRLSYDLLGLMSYFTVGEDEVRAWTIKKGATAQEAAGVIHTDIARGFIRAEVVDYETTIAMGGFDDAKKKGKMRLEGKEYIPLDGDVMSFRFNV